MKLIKHIIFISLFGTICWGQSRQLPRVSDDFAAQYFAAAYCTSSGCQPSPITKAFAIPPGIGYWKIIFIPDGTVSGCTVTLDGSSNQAATPSSGSLIASQSCTSSGSFTTSSAVYQNYATLTPTITGSGNVSFILLGFVGNPAGASAGNVTITSPLDGSNNVRVNCEVGCSSSVPTTSLSGQQAVTGTAAALATNTTKGLCVKANAANTINVYLGGAGVTTSTGFELDPGDSYCTSITNSNAIFVVASTTGAGVSFQAQN